MNKRRQVKRRYSSLKRKSLGANTKNANEQTTGGRDSGVQNSRKASISSAESGSQIPRQHSDFEEPASSSDMGLWLVNREEIMNRWSMLGLKLYVGLAFVLTLFIQIRTHFIGFKHRIYPVDYSGCDGDLQVIPAVVIISVFAFFLGPIGLLLSKEVQSAKVMFKELLVSQIAVFLCSLTCIEHN